MTREQRLFAATAGGVFAQAQHKSLVLMRSPAEAASRMAPRLRRRSSAEPSTALARTPVRRTLSSSAGPMPFLVVPIARFLYFYAIGDGSGHLQSLVLGGVVVVMSFVAFTAAQIPGIDDATFQKAAHETKKNCVVSKALSAVDIQLEATLES